MLIHWLSLLPVMELSSLNECQVVKSSDLTPKGWASGHTSQKKSAMATSHTLEVTSLADAEGRRCECHSHLRPQRDWRMGNQPLRGRLPHERARKPATAHNLALRIK